MEDAHATVLSMNTDADADQVAFFGVYDGHGGEKAAIFTGLHLHELVRQTEAYAKKDYSTALKDGFLLCDQAILQNEETRNDESGCAATSAIITPTQVICANAGDSRTVLSRNGFAKALSFDHKPYNEGEKARICAGGGYVEMGRVNGNLALSRGIGDFLFKKNADLPAEEQIVTCYPEVITHDLDYEKDEFVILACDGIWDCLSSQSSVECVRRGIYERKPFTQICEEMMELCCAPNSDGPGIGCDNMSILIVALLDQANNETLDQWYDRIIAKIEVNKQQMEQHKPSDDSEDVPIAVDHGPISPEYSVLYKELFGDFAEIGQHSNNDARSAASNGYSMFGNMGMRSGPRDDDDDEDQAVNADEDPALKNGAISLQKLLSSNVITNENGVIYLDTSSAQSLLASFGMPAEGKSEDEDEDDVHEKHVEEVDDSASESN